MTETLRPWRLIDLIRGVDNVPIGWDYNGLYKLLLPNDSRTHGYLTPDTVSKLPWTDDFSINHKDRIVQVTVAENQADHINAAFQAVVDGALALGTSVFPNLTSHSEMVRIIGAKDYPSRAAQKPEPIRVERFAASLFGICSRGAHLTAYVRDESRPVSKGMRIWVARRDANLHTYPGMLDTTVAGGVKASDTPRQCIVAESDEEAALPLSCVEAIVSAGVTTYVSQNKKTGQVRPTILYVYDLELGEDMRPEPKDGEVQEFSLMTVEEVTRAMINGQFKPNCCLVMLDFFVRHGIITDENEKDYLDIVTGLRRKLPVPVTAQEL
ncbi:NUDIX domain-containing protein [Diaporthe helianthi]|uniref:NUDIX domain-containing protein n=1 Tax=Diaporthe helianthi TaxID=158607 RepID=A0A2P5HH69_DIAHE|nr:NUDIX domain-containing protein [Diaporthe helianthi]